MSQDDEETTKYKLNNNHKNNNYKHHGPTKKTQNNQQVVPLYENFTTNNNNNTNNGKPDHSMLEQATTQSETFNNDHRFVRNTTFNADINEQETRDSNSIASPEYENISFGVKDNFDKKILLQKYFRSALVGPRSNIYENLCRGCNYGVFNARGPLCTFCECIVNGVSALRSETPEVTASNNIYENICEFCGVIYSGSNCSECNCRENEQVKREDSNRENNFLKVGSEELLIEKSVKEKKKVKLNKSKSFNKSNKPKIFTNFWDTLRKPKNITGTSSGGCRKPLEIIHHVEGYEQVFHTKETFDLQKICELKRSGTSCSDQHIYGRLKLNELSISQEEFNSTQSLTQSPNGNNKKPRISKVKFLRIQPSSVSSLETESSEFTAAAGTIYLNNSVCQWMTSLRREIHAYNTFMNGGNEVDQDTLLCYPKSIPSKNVLISCKAPVTNHPTKNLQNFKNLLQQLQLQQQVSRDCCDLTEIQTLISHNSMTSIDSWEFEERTEEEALQQKQPDCYQLMVEEFMANIINRQMLKTKDSKQQQQQKIDNVKAMAGVNNNDSYTNNKNNITNNSISTDIPLRQANLTCTTTTMTAHNHNNNNRHKRQGMYLRLEDHQQLQQLPTGEEQLNLHNNKKVNNLSTNNHVVYQQQTVIPGERVKIALENNNNNNNENENPNSLHKTIAEHNTVTTPDTSLAATEELQLVSRAAKSPVDGWDLKITDKRRGIHERNVLEAFEALLEQERSNQLIQTNEEQIELDSKPITITTTPTQESQKCEIETAQEKVNTCEAIALPSLQLQTFGDNPQSISQHFPTQILDVIQLINQQQLSTGLNTSIICYDKYLKVFLQFIYQTNNKTRTIAYKIPNKQLVRKFKQFYNYCEKTATSTTTTTTIKKPKTTMRELTCVSSNLKLDLNITPAYNCAQNFRENYHESLVQKTSKSNGLKQDKCTSVIKTLENPKQIKVKTPPQVPKRDPKTKLSPTTEIKRFSPKMTVPANNLKTDTETENPKEEEESIYQPIWKFETKGKVAERYQTDDDYYDLKALKDKIKQESPHTEIPKILISDDILIEEEEDHNNWEPDEEFVFTKQKRSLSLTSDRNSTIRSNLSLDSSIGTSSSLSGSTITEFASSTATLASSISSSLRHHWYRNIGIFYSLTEPKLRAIIYDYDRIHSSRYFAKPKEQVNNDSGLGKSLSPIQPAKLRYVKKSSSNSSSPSTSASSSPVSPTKRENLAKSFVSASESVKYNGARAKVATPPPASTASSAQIIPSSVQAWKRQLLDVNCMEDEEDMIVSECEIKRAQQIREDIDQSPDTQPQLYIQRFKSRSTDNLDLPNEDDKKTFSERLANMYTRFSPIQRGILNIRSSPKGDKKVYKRNRASQSTSLYLEDGPKPKPPIFGAPLHQLELQQNVPRFVVDTVDYIERKDRIIQDGLYRACGNKFSIDELKLKLTKSYIYDSKLIVADDIHTVTSLLKQFFRDLPEPLIPQDIYNRITVNLTDKESIDTIRIAIEEMKEPNKSTLRFLIKHLTNVAACSSSNRMNASNMAIVWGPSLFALNDTYDMIGRMNTLTKVLIENYDRIFDTNERLL